MTDLRTAAQQAMEALEEINKLSIGENAICLPAEIDDAMDALRAALAEPVQDWSLLEATQASLREHMAEIQRLQAALAEPVQEPVAHLWQQNETGRTRVVTPDQGITADDGWRMVGPLYLVPPQRKPLTDEEIAAEWRKASEFAGKSEGAVTTSQFVQIFARAIERAHGITGDRDGSQG